MKSVDDISYHKYFAPRRPDSRWLEKNRKLVEELRQAGKLTPQGEAAITAAKSGGTWDVPAKPMDVESLLAQFETIVGSFPLARENDRKGMLF